MGTEEGKYKSVAFTQFYNSVELSRLIKEHLRKINIARIRAKKSPLNRSAFLRGLELFAFDRLEQVDFDDPRIDGKEQK